MCKITHYFANSQKEASNSLFLMVILGKKILSKEHRKKGNRRSAPKNSYIPFLTRQEHQYLILGDSWMPKPLTVWITINCGKFFKRWEYQTT